VNGNVVHTEPTPSEPLTYICAYCGSAAIYMVRIERPSGTLIGAGFCCDEPTHWAWLVSFAEEFHA
jgi:hypothetical protein